MWFVGGSIDEPTSGGHTSSFDDLVRIGILHSTPRANFGTCLFLASRSIAESKGRPYDGLMLLERMVRMTVYGAALPILAFCACTRTEDAKPREGSGETLVAASHEPVVSAEPKSQPAPVLRDVKEYLEWVGKVRPIIEAGPKPQDEHPEVGRVTCKVSPEDKEYYDYGYCTAKPLASAREVMWPAGKPTIWEASLVLSSCHVELDCAALGMKQLGVHRTKYREIHHCYHTEDQQVVIDNVKENDGTVVVVFKKEYPLEKDPAGETPRVRRFQGLP